MHTLKLQEMREIESMRSRSGPMRGPGIADLASEASTWAEEYLATETHVQVSPHYIPHHIILYLV